MKYIVLDLEMNPIHKDYKAERRICRNEIIEIGAVLLDEEYQEIGCFKTLVKPEYNYEITRNITRLTGINTEMVIQAPKFKEAANMFFQWCEAIEGEIQVLHWSKTDFQQIIKEIQLKDFPLDDENTRILHCWYDFQKEYDDTLGVDRQMALTQAMMLAGVEFVGRQHDALYDARNTGVLLKTVRDEGLCELALQNVIDALKPEKVDVALGELFDFSVFNLSA